uniref:Urocortin-3 isoform X2 n=1 Tax=Phascolarctos cinereus TaxID=38626 RepID=A0A6P5J561_PHACI|nr:urocortin-3 isoform X2 [Phascolarctos cinereus]
MISWTSITQTSTSDSSREGIHDRNNQLVPRISYCKQFLLPLHSVMTRRQFPPLQHERFGLDDPLRLEARSVYSNLKLEESQRRLKKSGALALSTTPPNPFCRAGCLLLQIRRVSHTNELWKRSYIPSLGQNSLQSLAKISCNKSKTCNYTV